MADAHNARLRVIESREDRRLYEVSWVERLNVVVSRDWTDEPAWTGSSTDGHWFSIKRIGRRS